MTEIETIHLINKKLINDVVDMLGKEEAYRRYNRVRVTNPESYADTCKGLGQDVLEFISSL